MTRFALASRRLVTGAGVGPGCVVVDGDRIAHVGPTAGDVPVEDVGDLAVMAGLVDTHVHLNEPGRVDWEGFETATRAAAAGGVTTLVDMPLNCDPVTTTPEALRTKLASTEGRLMVDVGFWGGVVPEHLDRLPALARAGVLGCKAFLCHSGLDAFPNVDEPQLRRGMEALRDAGIPLLVHAELEDAVAQGGDPRKYETYLASRPPSFEVRAIELVARLVEETGARAHIVHLSAADALPVVRRAKDRGLPLSAETCPHYLCLDAESVGDGETQYKCAPPIRDRDNQARLWSAVLDGTLDFVVTDHSPCTLGLKRLDTGHFPDAWGGICSLQLGLPAIWTRASALGADVSSLARWMAERPAAFAGLSQKGSLRPGADADLVVWDPDARFAVRAQDLFVKNKLTPYEGRSLAGVVHRTYLRGARVFDHASPSPFSAPTGRPLLRA